MKLNLSKWTNGLMDYSRLTKQAKIIHWVSSKLAYFFTRSRPCQIVIILVLIQVSCHPSLLSTFTKQSHASFYNYTTTKIEFGGGYFGI